MATDKLFNHQATAHSPSTIDKIRKVELGGKLSDVEKTYGSTYRRLDPNKPAPTVTRSGYRDFIHPYEDRMLTVRELACIQSFPLEWEFKGVRLDSYSSKRNTTMTQFGQVGNAVPPKLAESIALAIHEQWFALKEEIQGMMFASAGVSIDGSWRNAIGTEGERVIRTIILSELLKHNEVSSISDKQNRVNSIETVDTSDVLAIVDNARSINLSNGYSLLFGLEPDVTMIDDNGDIIGAIEIKAGLDPAGALERLGAVLKSFETILTEYPNATTILVSSCTTSEVETRLGSSMSIRHKFITTEITTSESNQRKFVNCIRRVLKLAK